MAIKRFEKLKNLSLEELKSKIHETQVALFQARMKKKTYELTNTASIWSFRKDLARMKMLVTQRNLKVNDKESR